VTAGKDIVDEQRNDARHGQVGTQLRELLDLTRRQSDLDLLVALLPLG